LLKVALALRYYNNKGTKEGKKKERKKKRR
jgi:hypothetical protein